MLDGSVRHPEHQHRRALYGQAVRRRMEVSPNQKIDLSTKCSSFVRPKTHENAWLHCVTDGRRSRAGWGQPVSVGVSDFRRSERRRRALTAPMIGQGCGPLRMGEGRGEGRVCGRHAIATVLSLVVLYVPVLAHAHADPAARIAYVNRQLEAHPHDASLYLQRGDLHRLAHNWNAALADYTRALENDPQLDAAL